MKKYYMVRQSKYSINHLFNRTNYTLFLMVLIFIWFASSAIEAQWEPTNGPPNVEITSSLAAFTIDSGDTNLYAGTYHGGIFLSTDNGNNWRSLVGENWTIDSGSFTKSSITALLPVQDEEVI
jgi:hypothetical protein